MRLIDADKMNLLLGISDRDIYAKRMLDHMDTVDAVPVTRCKDCKHRGWVQEPCHGNSVDYCKIWDCTLLNLEATFCSYGERRDKP